MTRSFEINISNRKILQKFIENYSIDQLNTIPIGFNNNLIWNIGHIIGTQQRLIYRLSQLPINVPDQIDDNYRRGTKPEYFVELDEVSEIESLLFNPIYQTQKDLESGVFSSFSPFTTMTGYTIQSVEDAIEFNNTHEAIHIGIMMSIAKLI